MLEQTILWRRIDSPGHDACGLWVLNGGWRLAGTAVFRLEERACHLRYEVDCDLSWRTRYATVTGWIGRKSVDLAIVALPGEGWTFNGVKKRAVAGLVDVDLGFTPATNLIQLRRLALEVGQEAEAPAVYLHFPELKVGRLDHWYRRVAADRYDYKAPVFDYAAVLQVSDAGFVTHYPELWELEALQ